MLIQRMLKKGLLPFLLLLFLAGCMGGEKETSATWLLSCKGRWVTVGDYQDALKLALQGYPYEGLSRTDEVVAIREGVLHQLQEELLILCLADEKGILLGEAELDKAVQNARKGYPEGGFEKELMSRGISLAMWKRRLAKRLWVEKTLATEFVLERPLTYKDFQAASGERTQGLSEQALIHRVKRSRMETGYRSWRQEVEGKYSIDVNGKLWEKILEEGRP
ncbi:hypothetical protein [Desulfoluna sp.]|uniref:hypothetical protein n=1 Tax=Desulfoluna sp. TaxID=2045199 RepID=UPI00261EDD2A|nr:hypothetical protein [Desulfoluna sp.]